MEPLLTKTSDLEKLKIFRSPLCLISADANMMLTVVEETLDDLARIGLPLNVVSIIGQYRTGKSYLMNRLAGAKKGFAMGTSIQAKTKGIWAWCLMHPEQKDQVLVLLDTKGLGDIEKGDADYDNRLFTMAVLLSSTLVYNNMGMLNQETLDNITCITEIAKNMKLTVNRKEEHTLFDPDFPVFVLCVRDFHLELPGTPNQYLDEVFRKRKPGTDPDVLKFNSSREMLKRHFKVRECFTFERPGGRDVLKRLEDVSDRNLESDFLKDIAKFTSYVYKCRPKQIQNGDMVNGKVLAFFAKSYIETMRQGPLPYAKGARVEMMEAKAMKTVEAVVAEFREQLSKIKLPQTDKGQLQMIYRDLQRKAFEVIRKQLVDDDDRMFENAAARKMTILWETVRQKNDDILMDQHLDALGTMYQEVAEKVDTGEYKRAERYATYQENIENIRRAYKRERKDTYEAKQQFGEMEKDEDLDFIREDQPFNVTKEMKEEMQRLERDTYDRNAAEHLEYWREQRESEERKKEKEKRARIEREEEKQEENKMEITAIHEDHACMMELREKEFQRQLQERMSVANMQAEMARMKEETERLRRELAYLKQGEDSSYSQ